MFHGWRFDPDGDQAAADSTRSSTSLDTGSSVNPRTARRLVTASYTSMIAYLTPAIAMPVMKHRRNQGNELHENTLSYCDRVNIVCYNRDNHPRGRSDTQVMG